MGKMMQTHGKITENGKLWDMMGESWDSDIFHGLCDGNAARMAIEG